MTDCYAVIGNPIGHTKSPLIHGLFAQATNQDMQYDAIEGPLDGFTPRMRAFIDAGGRGINITAPFKLEAFALADERSERAMLAGATNALKFDGSRIVAENFDGVGLVRDEVNLKLPMANKRVLLLGAELEDVTVDSFQTNSEGAMCERIHRAFEQGIDAVLINAGAWT